MTGGRMKDDLEALAPIPKRVTIAGRGIELLPLRIRQLPAFSRAVSKVGPLLAEGRLMEALAADGEGVIEAIAIAADVDREWLDGLYPDDFLDLAAAVVEVNLDFFGQRLRPALEAAQERLAKAMISAGERSSPGSADGGTVSTKSSH